MAEVPSMKQYIGNNLSTKNFKENTASVIDHNRNLVRLICSDSAGMGKWKSSSERFSCLFCYYRFNFCAMLSAEVSFNSFSLIT